MQRVIHCVNISSLCANGVPLFDRFIKKHYIEHVPSDKGTKGMRLNNSWELLYGKLYPEPKTLNDAIRKFLSSLELTDKQADLVASRQKAVRERAESNSVMEIAGSLLIGSYPRDTQIRPLTTGTPTLDVDALLILRSTEWNLNTYWHIQDGGTKLLQDTLIALHGYQALLVKEDRPSITIHWKDLKMELTPAFHRSGGGYLIPARDRDTKSWTSTNPIGDADALTAANKDCHQELVPLIKMLKCWNRHQGKPVSSSFAVETIAFESARYGYRGYSFEIPWFFGKLLELDEKWIEPPSSVGDSLYLYLGSSGRHKVKASKEQIERAFYEAETGNHATAIFLMGKVFGKPFPGTQ